MLNVYVVGRNELIGKIACDMISQTENMVVIGGYDYHNKSRVTYFQNEEFNSDINLENVDVIIDFLHSSDTIKIVKAAVKCKVPMIISVDGFSDEQESIIEEASKIIPILRRVLYFVNAEDAIRFNHHTELLTIFAKDAIICAEFLANTRNIYFNLLENLNF